MLVGHRRAVDPQQACAVDPQQARAAQGDRWRARPLWPGALHSVRQRWAPAARHVVAVVCALSRSMALARSVRSTRAERRARATDVLKTNSQRAAASIT